MRHKSALFVGLLILLPASVALAQGGGNGNAMSPVGAWNFTGSELDGTPTFTVLQVFNFGGTTTAAANNGPEVGGYGSWEKTGPRTFRFSNYLPLFDPDHRSPDRQWFDDGVHVGHVLVLGELTIEDKDNMTGRVDFYILLGTDPLRPIDSFPGGSQLVVGERLPLRAPQ